LIERGNLDTFSDGKKFDFDKKPTKNGFYSGTIGARLANVGSRGAFSKEEFGGARIVAPSAISKKKHSFETFAKQRV
jgi:hypothetical protein